ncbi:reverse transcriptase domain-containing protein [Serratia marcescens]|uniref:reverse transcriptase domain-containing protein n=1 Tax=Serratia marcescens TaxID=615 RepID=UPI001EF84E5B|nr:reverse transcriptase domain-containing protein [Serratia marcescens]
MSIPDINEQRTPLCRVTAGERLDAAWDWLCDARKDAPSNADIWHLRHHWHRTRDALLTRLLNGEYRLQPMLLTKKRPHHDRQVMWGAQDALVLKWTAMLIAPHLDLHPRCEHVKGHGGGPQSVHRMHDALTTHNYTWVCRTDVKGYYRHINKDRLMEQVKQCITDPVLQDLIHQYLHYTVEDGGEFHTPEAGIARGCALSPLMGALHLYAMDAWFGQQMERAKKNGTPGIYYARYMDDVVILAHTRWQLRKQVRALNQFFNEAGFCQHPDKTFIGRTARGYDWMGAQMSDVGVEGIAHRARANHLERLRRLYEQVRRWPAAQRRARMSQYRMRWTIWAMAIACCTYPMYGITSIGNVADLRAGITKCMQDGSFKTTSKTNYGGTCVISMPFRSFTPTTPTGAQTSGWRVWNSTAYIRDVQPRTYTTDYSLTIPSDLVIRNNRLTLTWAGPQTYSKTDVKNSSCVPCSSTDQYWGSSTASSMYPQDYSTGGWTYGSQADGSFSWSINAPIGTAIQFPELQLVLGNGPSAPLVIYGIGGNDGTDPTPPITPIAGDPPNCTAITGVAKQTYDFGSATAGASVGKLSTSKSIAAHALSLSCNAGANGSIGASAVLYVQSSNMKSSDMRSLLGSAGDWIGMALAMPASLPSGVSLASGQILNTPVTWNGSGTTPLWTWAIPAKTAQGAITLPTVSLQPQINQLQASPGTQDGLRTYTVAYSTVIQ